MVFKLREVIMKKLIVLLAAVTAFIFLVISCAKTTSSSPSAPGESTATSTPTQTATISATPYVIFQQNISPSSYAGTYDNCLLSTSPDFNMGDYGEVTIGKSGTSKYRYLVRFDITTGIPTGATIHGAELIMRSDPVFSLATSITAYEQVDDWGELTSTWNKRDGVNDWGSGFPGGWPGSIVDSVYIGSAVEHIFDISATLLNTWINTPSSNHGIILVKDNEDTDGYINLYSKDYSVNEALRPKLKIYYTAP
jgi:hypothetical protein